ncbi:MAG: DUF4864 domain-containing protein [Nitrospirae bacterium]|nr:DUF4864 domain-containing protein [Candidatus Manganitrophaceae bacterium]
MLPFFLLWSALFIPTRTAQTPTAQSPTAIEEIQSIIQQQLDAFNLNDYETAYHLASTQVRNQFSPDQFQERIRTDYPQLTKSLRLTFDQIDLDTGRTHAVARIEVTGFNHKKITAEYQLIHEDEGWKIDQMAIVPLRASIRGRSS